MAQAQPFSAVARLVHWIMAAMILAMLFIGVGMVTTPTRYAALVSVHRPLGAAILLLAALRLIYRRLHAPPPLPPGMPRPIRLGAHLSHVALYGLMFAVPLVGWAMLSAGGYPVELYGALRLPPIVPQSAPLFAGLRQAHTVLALLLFLVFLAHIGAALLHGLVFRDGVFESMTAIGVKRKAVGPKRSPG